MIDELVHHGYRIGPGTLYPLLHRMEQAGLLVSEQRVIDGRRRRYYRATDHGRGVLGLCHHALHELAAELLPEDVAVRSHIVPEHHEELPSPGDTPPA